MTSTSPALACEDTIAKGLPIVHDFPEKRILACAGQNSEARRPSIFRLRKISTNTENTVVINGSNATEFQSIALRMNLFSESSSLLTKEVVFSTIAGIGGVIVLIGLWKEWKSSKKDEAEANTEWFSNISKFRRRYHKSHAGEFWVMSGVAIEIIVAVVFATMDVIDRHNFNGDLNRIDPNNLPVLNINAFVKLRVKGKDFPDLTQWDSIPLSTNWGSKRATLTFCGSSPNSVLSSSIPSMISDDFGRGTGFPDSREYFLNFRMESVSAALTLPLQSASKSFDAANFVSLDVKFLPPQSEILDGYAFVVVNNSLWKLFRIFPQKDTRPPFPNEKQAAILSKFPLHPMMRWTATFPNGASASVKMSTLEPGKLTVLTNGEIFPVEATFFPADFVIVGTNAPSDNFGPNW